MALFSLESEIHLTECRRIIFAVVTIFIIILSVYSNTFNASWHFDDIPNITNNPHLHLTELSWDNIRKTFFAKLLEPEHIYRPAACLSFALNYYFGRDDVFGYHLVNISIHFITSIFLFLFIYNTLRLPVHSAKYSPHSYFIALLSTILWAINPIQTQAITYIVQRMASMAGMFYLISMHLYLKGRTASHPAIKILLFSLCAISAALSFLSKENALLILMSLLLFDFLVIQGASREKTKRNLKILLVVFFITLGILAIFSIFFKLSFPSLFGLYTKRPFTLWERLLTQPRVLIFYITLILYPMSTRLSLSHDIGISHSLFDPPTTILAVVLVIGILIGAIYLAKKKEPLISFCVLFFFLNHVIESSILPLELVFEHRNYIPSMFFFVPITICLVKAISYFSYKRSMQVILILSIIMVLIGEGHATFMRNFTWKNEESLWIDHVDKYPNLYRPRHNLAKYYQDRNEMERAIKEYEKALTLKGVNAIDEKAITYFNLGFIHFQRNEFEKAKQYYLEAMKINPCLPGLHNNLAVILAATTKDFHGVYDELTKELRCNPSSMRALSNIGILLVNWGRIDDGIAEIKKALIIEPHNIPTLERLGYAYLKKGLLGTASLYFKRMNSLGHRDMRALLYLSQIYILSGQEEKAKSILTRFVDIMQDRNLIPFLDDLQQETSLLQTTPDLHILLPLLRKVYQQRTILVEENSKSLLNISKE